MTFIVGEVAADLKQHRPHRGVHGIRSDAANSTNQVETGVGSIMPWADHLWFATYPGVTGGDSQKGAGLWRMDADGKVELVAQTEGCHAGRWVHSSTQQAILGEHAIGTDGTVHHITGFGSTERISAYCTNPNAVATNAWALTMEGKLYDVNLTTYTATLYKDLASATYANVPSGLRHFKSMWKMTSGLVVCSNYQAPNGRLGYYDWAADTWTALDSAGNSWVEAAGSFWAAIGADGAQDAANAWAFGHNHSETGAGAGVMWQLGSNGKSVAKKFRLPMFREDQLHGWQQEWMRLRAVSTERFLLDHHGTLYSVSPLLSGTNNPSAATSYPLVTPIATHYRTFTDFAVWEGNLVFGTDDQTMQGTNFPNVGQSASGLYFTTHEDLMTWGKPTGTGNLFTHASTGANQLSDPMLMRGYDKKSIHFANADATAVTVKIKIYRQGESFVYSDNISVPANGYAHHEFPEGFGADWVAVATDTACADFSCWVVYS